MKYYEHNGNLYTSNSPLNNKEFVELTQEEYELQLNKIKVEYSLPSIEENEWIGIDTIIEQDYMDTPVEMRIEL